MSNSQFRIQFSLPYRKACVNKHKFPGTHLCIIEDICFLCCELHSTGKLRTHLELLEPIKPK